MDVPVLDIPVNDEKFTAFLAKFDKHTEDLGKLPGVWANVGKAIGANTAQFDKIAASAAATAAATERMAAQQDKFLKLTQGTSYAMEGLARHTGGVARSLAEGAASLLKWSTITTAIGGLLGVGGLWGLDRLAAFGGGARRSAMGLGVSSAQQQAFGINYQRILNNPSGVLGSIADMQMDPAGGIPFLSLGINDYQNKDPAQLALEAMDKIRARTRGMSKMQAGILAENLGWTKIMSLDEIRRADATPDSEWAQLRRGYAKDSTTLGGSDAHEKQWQDLLTTLDLAKTKIGDVLVDGLAPLAKPLSDLSTSVGDVIKAFLAAPELKTWIAGASDGLEHFAKFIDGPKFGADMERFVSFVGRVGHFLGGVSDAIYGEKAPYGPPDLRGGVGAPGGRPDYTKPYWKRLLPGLDQGSVQWQQIQDEKTARGETSQEQAMRWRSFGKSFSTSGDPARVAHDFFVARGYSEDFTAGIMGYLRGESGFNTHAWNHAGGGQGAQGIAQWRGPRIDRFRARYGIDPKDATYAQQLEFIDWELHNTEAHAGDIARGAPDAYRAGEDILRYFGRPEAKDFDSIGDERGRFAQQYAGVTQIGQRALRSPAPVTVVLQLHNPTSAQVQTASAQAATP